MYSSYGHFSRKISKTSIRNKFLCFSRA